MYGTRRKRLRIHDQGGNQCRLKQIKKMKHKALILILISFNARLNAQPPDYIGYTRFITITDSLILDSNYREALQVMNQLPAQYPSIFARHCVKALQLSVLNSDTISMDDWLTRSILKGVPLWMLRRSKITAPLFTSDHFKQLIRHSDSVYQNQLSQLNQSIRDTVRQLQNLDQKRTRRVNDGFVPLRYSIYGLQWIRNNKKQLLILKNMSQYRGFPGEKLIGLGNNFFDSIEHKKYFHLYGPSPVVTEAYIMLIHAYSRKSICLDTLWYREVLKGNMEAYQYASIMDFIAEYGKRKTQKYYNQWHSDPDRTHDPEINRRRIQLGLPGLNLKNRIEDENFRRRKAGISAHCVLLG